jgi:hypothetical protein
MKGNLFVFIPTLALFIVLTILIYIYGTKSETRKYIKSALETKENFSSGQLVTPDPLPGQTTEPVPGPAPASLNEHIPYHLLQGVLPDAKVDNQDNSKLNSCACHAIDFANRIQRTGNYTQLTNNYKRMNPDSCSAPFHELVNNFYQPQILDV